MTTQHGYIEHAGAPDFATAMTVGGGGGETIGEDGDGPLGVGTDFETPQYVAAQGFLSFDTSALADTPASATLTLGQFGFTDTGPDLVVAIYDWGTDVETADWRTPAQLAALTQVGRFTWADLPQDGSTFDIDIDPSGIAVGGTTRFIVFTENMKSPTTDPAVDQQVFIYGAEDLIPPALATTPVDVGAPTITSISPPRGNAAGGNTVTINGSGFATVTDVTFGATPAASFDILDDTQIAAVSPAGSAGAVDITVTNPGGTSAAVPADAYTFDDLDSPPDGPIPTYIRVVDIHGNAHTTSGLTDGRLPFATCESVTRTKNQPRQAVITFPVYAYTRDDIHIFTDDTGEGELHEIQVIRGDRVLFWGPAVSAEHDSEEGVVTLQCYDVMWYFTRLFLDAQRTNLLTNPSFETGDTTGWTDEGAVTSSINSDAVRGVHSLQLVSSTALGDIWEQQTISVTGTGIGTLVTFVFYFKIVGSLTGHAKDRRGLYVEARESGDLKTNNYYPIDEATPTGQWIRASTTIPVPPNTTWDLQVRLYSPPGTIRWDDGQAVAMQSISTASLTGNTYEPVDVKQIVGLIHAFVQDPTVGKKDLNIDLDNPTVGVTEVKHIQWADHISWPDQMSEWLDRDDCFDISIRAEIGPPSRTLVLHVPEQGTDRRGVTAIAYPGNAAKFHFNEDGGGSITDDTELDTDTGDGPDREEGHYADASLVDGLVLQAVNSAPTNTDPAGLDPIARDAVKKARRPNVLIVFTLVNVDGVAYDDLLELNDTMDFGIDRGWASLSGFGKITTMKEMPPSRTTEITMLKANPA